jgi:hypothetical protein
LPLTSTKHTDWGARSWNCRLHAHLLERGALGRLAPHERLALEPALPLAGAMAEPTSGPSNQKQASLGLPVCCNAHVHARTTQGRKGALPLKATCGESGNWVEHNEHADSQRKRICVEQDCPWTAAAVSCLCPGAGVKTQMTPPSGSRDPKMAHECKIKLWAGQGCLLHSLNPFCPCCNLRPSACVLWAAPQLTSYRQFYGGARGAFLECPEVCDTVV